LPIDLLTLAIIYPSSECASPSEKGGEGNGLLFPLFSSEYTWPRGVRIVLYCAGLFWMFLGVGIIADVFMGAIEVITSKETITETKTGAVVPVKVWNATVANLTLMALGSSAPEILLNVIEIVWNTYIAGDLGPSTIVGSAAFNLLIIIAVCVVAVVPVGTRKIDGLDVYGCTAFFSIFAYVWLVIILKVHTENVVDLWEALATFGMFPVLVWLAYMLDTGAIGIPGSTKTRGHVTQIGTSHFHPYEIEKYLQELEATNADLPLEKREEIMIAALQAKVKPSRAQYRMMATRNMTGGKRLKIQKPSKISGGTDLEMVDVKQQKEAELAVVNFKASAYSVLENAGKIAVVVTRSSGEGSLQVEYATEGVTANAGEDYIETKGTLTFKPGETEKCIEVMIIDDDEPEEDEMFIVKLANPKPNARVGTEGMTIVTIIDDDGARIFCFLLSTAPSLPPSLSPFSHAPIYSLSEMRFNELTQLLTKTLG
jgi:solute carrier family 8 (sodium/calcium exchanger)